jgi:glycosyltransferase involved in cell wall biosynthesis
MKSLAIIGTNGIPSNYGGFETLVEYLAEYLSDRYTITVFCTSKSAAPRLRNFNGSKLKYIPFKANNWQSIMYDITSILLSYRAYDKILILGASGTIIMPLFKSFRDKFIFNFGGMDWQRSKWNMIARWYLKVSEALGIKYSGHLVSDNQAIKDYIQKEYGRASVLIPYGGDHVFRVLPDEGDKQKYPFLNSDYALAVARIQSDNNVEMLLESFKYKPRINLVFIGNWNNSGFGINIKRKYSGIDRIILLDAIYNQRELNLIRSNCKFYIHGHSAGGTNPALVEAMSLSLPVFAYDCIYNRYTTDFKAIYFSDTEELQGRIESMRQDELEAVGKHMFEYANKNYKWQIVAEQYSKVFCD